MNKSMTRPVGRPGQVGTTLASLAVIGMCLSGCTNVANGFTGLQQRYGDPSDYCHAPRQVLIDAGNQFSKSMVTAAVAGGLGGAAAGAVIDRKNRAQGALIGLFSGALLAMAVDYYVQKQQQARTRAELISSIDADAANDLQRMITTNNAISSLTQCRQSQIAMVEQQYNAHAMTAPQARAQLQQIKAQVDADNQLIIDVLGDSANRERVYVKARADAGSIQDQGNGAPPPPPSSYGQPYTPPRPPQPYNPPPPPAGFNSSGTATSQRALNVRGGPNTNAPVVDHLQPGDQVMLGADAGNGWVAINHNGTQGFVLRSLLTQPSAPVPNTTQTALNTPDNGTSHFVKLNDDAKQRQQQHEQVDNDLQNKINDLSTIVG